MYFNREEPPGGSVNKPLLLLLLLLSSIEFLGYRKLQHEQNGCSLIHKASINKCGSAFSIF